MIFRGKPSSGHDVIRRVLQKGRYATSDLRAEAGSDHLQESALIRRIKESMISSKDYPLSPRAQRHRDRSEIAAWENEGGSTDANMRD